MKITDKVEYDETITFRKPETESKVKMTDKEMLALVVGASGRFNMMFFGSPGCGKTILMQHMMYLTPSLTEEESKSVKRIYSLAGLPIRDGNRTYPPFRMPHQTASIEGICGGGPNCRPGEITLAHNGVLFLDEAAEFRSSVLQMLRVPLETKSITLSRAGRSTTYPANFQLLMACNPCPCGNYGSKDRICLCSAKSIEQYWKKFSGPLLDRVPIKLHIDHSEGEREEHSLEELQTYVMTATIESRKLGKKFAELTSKELEDITPPEIRRAFSTVMADKDWSIRKFDNALKIWLTIRAIFGDDKRNYESYTKQTMMLLCDTPYELM